MTDAKTHAASAPPPGRGARIAAWAAYFFLGAGMLAPWNALISAADYYEAMWPGRHVDRLLTVCYLPTCLALLLLTMKLSAWTRLRLLATYAGYALAVVIIPITDLAIIPPDAHFAPESALSVVIAMAVAVGVFDGFGQGALYGDASLLPPEYTHAVVGGTASAGTLICILRAITKAAAPETVTGLRRASNAYFLVTVAVSLGCMALYGWGVPRLAVVKHYRSKKIEEGAHALPTVELASPKPVASPRSPRRSTSAAGAASPRSLTAAGATSFAERVRSLSPTGSIKLPHAVEVLSQPLAPETLPPPTLGGVWRARWMSIIAMFSIYVVTLSIFPGFLAEDVKNIALGSWYPVILFIVFNIGDLVGKLTPHFRLQPSQLALLICCLSRVAFVPAFFCAAKFGAPAWVVGLLTLLLGLSNGYLTALVFARAAVGLTAIEGDLAANFVVVGLVSGLNVGAYLGWLWLLAH